MDMYVKRTLTIILYFIALGFSVLLVVMGHRMGEYPGLFMQFGGIAGRSVRILHQLTQPADHPVDIYHPEGEYLKGLVLYVD